MENGSTQVTRCERCGADRPGPLPARISPFGSLRVNLAGHEPSCLTPVQTHRLAYERLVVREALHGLDGRERAVLDETFRTLTDLLIAEHAEQRHAARIAREMAVPA